MHRRTRLESGLVRYTAVFVLIYAPIEVWVGGALVTLCAIGMITSIAVVGRAQMPDRARSTFPFQT